MRLLSNFFDSFDIICCPPSTSPAPKDKGSQLPMPGWTLRAGSGLLPPASHPGHQPGVSTKIGRFCPWPRAGECSRRAALRARQFPRIAAFLAVFCCLCLVFTWPNRAYMANDPASEFLSVQHGGYRQTQCAPSEDIVIGTRFWGRSSADVDKIRDFVKRTARAVGPRLCAMIVAVNVDQDAVHTASILEPLVTQVPQLETYAIYPWAITSPLNTVVARAARLGATHTLFISVEVHLDARHLELLMTHVDDQTLVAAFAMRGHRPYTELSAGSQGAPSATSEASLCQRRQVGAADQGVTTSLEGDTIPWNTVAVWRTELLEKVGFLMDANLRDPPGMEEAVPIALIQKQFGKFHARAKLLHVPERHSPVWNVDFNSAERRAHQAKKMSSKRKRTVVQLAHMHLAADEGRVDHILVCDFVGTDK